MRSSVLFAARWCLSTIADRGGWRTPLGLLVLVPVLILLAGDHIAVEAEEYSAYSDPKKPAIAVILSKRQNVDQFKEHFGLDDGHVDDVLAATRRENRILAQVFGERRLQRSPQKGDSEEDRRLRLRREGRRGSSKHKEENRGHRARGSKRRPQALGRRAVEPGGSGRFQRRLRGLLRD